MRLIDADKFIEKINKESFQPYLETTMEVVTTEDIRRLANLISTLDVTTCSECKHCRPVEELYPLPYEHGTLLCVRKFERVTENEYCSKAERKTE